MASGLKNGCALTQNMYLSNLNVKYTYSVHSALSALVVSALKLTKLPSFYGLAIVNFRASVRCLGEKGS